MTRTIAVSKEPKWMKPIGLALVIPGFVALIPFKASYLEFWDLPFYMCAFTGVLILLRCTQQIGWRLNLEGNVLYYSKFNLFSNWKKIRSQEFALSLDKVTDCVFEGNEFIVSYRPSKRLRFNTRGMTSIAYSKLEKMSKAISEHTALTED